MTTINQNENINELMDFDDVEFSRMDFIYTPAQQHILSNRSPTSVMDIDKIGIPIRPKLRRQFAVIINT